jgi:hypothetical protein
MKPKLFASALAGLFFPADAVLAEPAGAENLQMVVCMGPASMDPYFISFDLPGRKAYVQRHLEIPPREAFMIEVLSEDSIEWTGVMKFKFDRRKNLLHETAIITTDEYQCEFVKSETP